MYMCVSPVYDYKCDHVKPCLCVSPVCVQAYECGDGGWRGRWAPEFGDSKGPWDLGHLAEELLLLTGLAGVYCYRVNRRLFLVPSDPGTPCRLCRTPRDQRGPETLAEPALVR